MIVYYLPLAYNSFKDFSTPEESFYCCVGTGFENHVKYAEGIYSENEKELYVNLFIASELDWKRQNLKIRQETTFPDTDKTKLTVTGNSAGELTFHIRYPEWANEGYTLKINGEIVPVSDSPGSYIAIKRRWKDGDMIEIDMVKSLHKELLLGDEHKTAYLNGPIVLAGELDPMEERTIVLLKKEEDLNTWIKPTDAAKTEFVTQTGYPANINLIPFYKKYKGNYGIYFDSYSPEE